ncbi:MAG: hypothetical protein Q4D25_01320 [Bacteroidales bacterium]|nr:hypothetical protein [Bacteroidales bacterium]
MRHKFLTLSTLTLLLSSLSACHGILDDIYDDPSNDVTLKEGQLYVDASSWTEWYYIDLLDTNKEWVSMSIPTEELPTLSPQPSTLNRASTPIGTMCSGQVFPTTSSKVSLLQPSSQSLKNGTSPCIATMCALTEERRMRLPILR